MDYFCYISRNKIDQLYASISKTDEWTEVKTTEQNLGTEIGTNISVASIIQLFKGGITYGRKGVIQREQKVKIHYIEKLHSVLIALAKGTHIPSLGEAIRHSTFDSLYYHYQGQFSVDKESVAKKNLNSQSIVSIQSKALDHKLIFDCSLRFFSEGNEPDGTFNLHSGNSRFFSGDIELELETIFLLLSRKPKTIFGTPLFLKLSIKDGQGTVAV